MGGGCLLGKGWAGWAGWPSLPWWGSYQWESVDHETASAIIQGAVAVYIDQDARDAVEALERNATATFRDVMRSIEL